MDWAEGEVQLLWSPTGDVAAGVAFAVEARRLGPLCQTLNATGWWLLPLMTRQIMLFSGG